MDKVLVTGGAGFIGVRTSRALLELGYDVRVFDVLKAPVHPAGEWPAEIPAAIERIHGDVRNPHGLARALDGVRFVLHLAAYQDYLPDFSTFISSNATSTALLFELIAARRLPVEKVVIASSQSVYGEGRHRCPEHGVQFPDGRPLDQLRMGRWEVACARCGQAMTWQRTDEGHANPQNAYAISKLTQELLGLRLGRRCQVPTVALRYSITQGAGQSVHNAYSGICRIFSSAALRGRPFRIYEDGLQRRDYVYVDDVVRANLMAMRDARLDGEAVNVGGAEATTVLEYARTVADAAGVDYAFEMQSEFRVGDSRHLVSDSSKLERLGWRQTKGVREIVAEYLDWLRQQPAPGGAGEAAYQRMRELGAVGARSPR